MAQRTATSAGAIIVREMGGTLKIALAHHAHVANSWVLPKGHVEAGETLEQAALREISEEAGLTNVQLITHLGTILRESVKSNGDTEQKTIHLYLAYALSEQQASQPTDTRFVEVGWFSPKEAIDLLPNASDQAFLRDHLGLLLG